MGKLTDPANVGGLRLVSENRDEPDLAGWHPGRTDATSSAFAAGDASASMLTSALRMGELIDTRSIQLAGAMIVLPRGERLLRRFRATARTEYAAAGYEEYDFPLLAPAETYGPIDSLFPLASRLMKVGGDDDWSSARPRAVLQPSGEAVVSAYLRSRVRTDQDLPIRILRHTRYVRPMPRAHRSGRGVFRSMEASDIFETHACVAPEQSPEELAAIAVVLERLCAWARVPTIVTERPLWGNNSAISRMTIGFDAVHPVGGTIQVASAYNQADLISDAYGTSFKRGNVDTTPHQVTSAVTRRLILMHVFQYLRTDGFPLIHPNVADEQLRLALPPDCDDIEGPLARALQSVGVRAAITRSAHPKAALTSARKAGVPLRAALLPDNEQGTRRCIIVRGDDQRELHPGDVSVGGLARLLARATRDVGAAMDREVDAVAESRYRRVDGIHDVETIAEWTRARGVVDLPIVEDQKQLRDLEEIITGEVLGIYRTSTPTKCVMTGRSTVARAVASPRG